MHSKEELHLYFGQKYQYTYEPYTLTRHFIPGSGPEDRPLGRLIFTVPEGHQVKVISFRRERGAGGYVWDHMLGEILVPENDGPVIFEYLIGLSDEHRIPPFTKQE